MAASSRKDATKGILFGLQVALLVLNVTLSVGHTGNFALLLLFNLGVLFYLSRMGSAIGKGAHFGKRYTRILIPSFVFILFADIFFVIIISLFERGIFRGWLSRKPMED